MGLKERLVNLPGARHVRQHLLAQGHTEKEADFGALFLSVTGLVVAVVLFNTFLLGSVRAFFNGLWTYGVENPVTGVLVAIFATLLFLSVLFMILNRLGSRKEAEGRQLRLQRERIEEKRQLLERGAMGNFEEVFRFRLKRLHPGIEVKSVHMMDLVPRIRFQALRINTSFGEKVDKNYGVFRDTLFSDVLKVLETAFGLAGNIPAVVVDAGMRFINRRAEYYDGVVLSVKAERAVFEPMERSQTAPFKVLAAFDLRYNDGMEVQPLPQEASKVDRVMERLLESAPKLHVHYEVPRKKVDDGWEAPREAVSPEVMQETLKGKELNALSPGQFQDMVTGLLSKMSYQVRGVKKIPGGALQVLADYAHPVIGGNFMVLARQFPGSAPVHADLVRDLDALAREESCKRAAFLVTGRFTEEARNACKKLAVDLVDLPRLAELLDAPPYDGRWTIQVADEKGVVQDLSRLPLLYFEKEVDRLLKNLGFRVEKIRRAAGGAVMAVAVHDHPVTGGKFAVMARQFPEGERVAAELVSELTHVMSAEFCHRGLLMATSGLSREAQALARFSNVELVDRDLWENLRRRI